MEVGAQQRHVRRLRRRDREVGEVRHARDRGLCHVAAARGIGGGRRVEAGYRAGDGNCTFGYRLRLIVEVTDER